MLNHEKEIICINIADLLFYLFYNDVFLQIANALQLWNNYELLFVIEIPEENNIVAAKMNKGGLIYCFPDDTYLFKKFIEYKTTKSYDRLQQENPENITTIEEIERVFKFMITQPIYFDEKSSRNDMTHSLFYQENENIVAILNNILMKSAMKNILRILFIYKPEVNLLLGKMIEGKYGLHDSIDGHIEEEWEELLKTKDISLYIETKCIFEGVIPPEH